MSHVIKVDSKWQMKIPKLGYTKIIICKRSIIAAQEIRDKRLVLCK